MSGYNLQLNESNLKNKINDIVEAMLILDVTEKNVDSFFKLEGILKSNEDEMRIKKQLIRGKIRKYFHETGLRHLEKYSVIRNTT